MPVLAADSLRVVLRGAGEVCSCVGRAGRGLATVVAVVGRERCPSRWPAAASRCWVARGAWEGRDCGLQWRRDAGVGRRGSGARSLPALEASGRCVVLVGSRRRGGSRLPLGQPARSLRWSERRRGASDARFGGRPPDRGSSGRDVAGEPPTSETCGRCLSGEGARR